MADNSDFSEPDPEPWNAVLFRLAAPPPAPAPLFQAAPPPAPAPLFQAAQLFQAAPAPAPVPLFQAAPAPAPAPLFQAQDRARKNLSYLPWLGK